MTNKENCGAKSAITQKKIDNLYKVVQMYKTDSLIAQALGVDVRTFKTWIGNGEEILSSHSELKSELIDCALDGYTKAQEIVDVKIAELEEIFLEATGATELHAKNKVYFDEYVRNYKKELVEIVVNDEENKLIDEYKFDKSPAQNERLVRYVKVARIYSRAMLSMKGQYISNVDRHASNSKNVGFSWKFLEITEESFKPQVNKSEVTHKGSISLVSLLKEESKEDSSTKKEEE